jgi:hypothetical protein
MKELCVDDVVWLTSDIPNLNLQKGQKGVVRSLWLTSQISYEVEFAGLDERTRAVLLREQLAGEGEGSEPIPHRAPAVEGSATGAW